MDRRGFWLLLVESVGEGGEGAVFTVAWGLSKWLELIMD